MKNFRLIFQKVSADESGQDLIEYALIAALIGLAAVATLKALATALENVFSAIQAKLEAAVT